MTSISDPCPGDTVESPIINRPYEEPLLHLALNPASETNNYPVKNGRRPPGHVHEKGNIPSTPSAIEPYPLINRVRAAVSAWRENGYPGIDRRINALLHHWSHPDNGNRIFFCQREAIETLIWLNTARDNEPDRKDIQNILDHWNRTINDGLPRISTKMATGTGKTAVMAMLMLYYALRRKNPIRDFLVITPGITVTERLRELYPGPFRESVYRTRNLLPPGTPMPPIHLKIVHRHRLEPRKTGEERIKDTETRRAIKSIVEDMAAQSGGHETPPEESFHETMNRIFGTRPAETPVVVINDEAHHCYAGSSTNKDEARWYTAIKRIRDETTLAIKAVHDFSATPIWIADRPAAAPKKGEVFPWTVSDFPLVEAVESGLVKVPRTPDHAHGGDEEVGLKNLYQALKDEKITDTIPPGIAHYLRILAEHHLTATRKAYKNAKQKPIFCIVVNDIKTATAFFHHVGGTWDEDSKTGKPGPWKELSNIDIKGKIKEHPPTLLVHSKMGEEGQKETEKTAKRASDLLRMFGDPSAKSKYKVLDEKVRAMFMTAGREGLPGEHIRCIVSVSMLTEGWDCRTVTEIFGYRPFGSDLLTEQVTGRALRRTDHVLEEDGHFRLQHANLIGVPFSWMPEGGSSAPTPKQAEPYECKIVEGREDMEIRIPRVIDYEPVPEGYHREFDPDAVESHNLQIRRHQNSITVSYAKGIPETLTSNHEPHTREAAVWQIASRAVDDLASREDEKIAERLSVMAEMIAAADAWLKHPVVSTKDDSFDLRLALANDRGGKIAETCAEALIQSLRRRPRRSTIRPVMDENRPHASSDHPKTFETTLPNKYPDPANAVPELAGSGLGAITRKSQRNVAPCHSRHETIVARILDESDRVTAWLRNTSEIRFHIPYRDPNGHMQNYEPDFVARSRKGNHLAIEYKGIWKGMQQAVEDAKRRFAETRWKLAINDHPDITGLPGKWDFLWIDGTKNDNIQDKIEKALDDLDKETTQ